MRHLLIIGVAGVVVVVARLFMGRDGFIEVAAMIGVLVVLAESLLWGARYLDAPERLRVGPLKPVLEFFREHRKIAAGVAIFAGLLSLAPLLFLGFPPEGTKVWWWHVGAGVQVLLLVGLAGSLWLIGSSKSEAWNRLTIVQEALLETFPWHTEPASDAELKQAYSDSRDILDLIVKNLEGQLDAGARGLFYKIERWVVRHDRLVSVWLPDPDEGHFYPVSAAPNMAPYLAVIDDYRPSMLDEDRYREFSREWSKRSPKTQAEREKYDLEKAEVTSLCGQVWHRQRQKDLHGEEQFVLIGDTRKIRRDVDVDDGDHLDRTLNRCFRDQRSGRRIPGFPQLDPMEVRSLYIRPLVAGGDDLGLLVMIDPLPAGLFHRDVSLIEAHMHLMETALRRIYFFAEKLGKPRPQLPVAT